MQTPVNKRLRSVKKLKKGSRLISLPDDLLILILIWLSMEDILRYRSVCRRWRDLTSTQYFINMHLQKSPPVILSDAFTVRNIKILLSRWWEPEPTIRIIRDSHLVDRGYRGEFLGHGIVASKDIRRREITLFNIGLKGKEVKIVLSQNMFWTCHAFAIYFHPTLREYCILWRDEGGTQYSVLNLGSKPCWKKIRNPWSHKFRHLDKRTRLLVDGCLYWCVEHNAIEDDEYRENFAIMEFDILREELKVMFFPVYAAVKYEGYDKNLLSNTNVNLLNVDGQVSLFLISPAESRVYKWTLKSREQESWTICKYCNISELGSYLKRPLRPYAHFDDHLLIWASNKILFVNFKLGTIKKLEIERRFLTYDRVSFSRVLSLVSLTKCKSKIIIEKKDDEIIVKAN